MTKAKKALDKLITLEGATHSDLETAHAAWVALFSLKGFVYQCKKALELLDKVESGGCLPDVNLPDCYMDDNFEAKIGFNEAKDLIRQKYILIER